MAFYFDRGMLLYSLLVIIPIVAGIWALGAAGRRQSRRAYGEERLLLLFDKPARRGSELAVLIAWLTAFTLILLSLAGPKVSGASGEVTEGSLQVVAIIDVSTSMAAEEYRTFMPSQNGVSPLMVPGSYGSRLDQAKLIIMTWIMPAIAGNQLGLVSYAAVGLNQGDLTRDFASLKWVMAHWLKLGTMPGGAGSNYAEGLKTALQIFENTPSTKEKVIVIFSDGGFDGDLAQLEETIEQVEKENIRVIVVGLGGDSPAPIPTYSEDGQLTGYAQSENSTQTTSVDESVLNALAQRMHAQYIRIRPGSKMADMNWASVLAPGSVESQDRDIYQYPLVAAAVVLLLLFMRRIRPGPTQHKSNFTGGKTQTHAKSDGNE